ncbi:hypothetical protein [Belliella baltica]|nr:hypothetical protein [Belliella baltica]
MSNTPPINFENIDEMADGDADFKAELVAAIYASLIELKEKYLEGAEDQNEETIHLIRHKVKPTLALFEIDKLSNIIQEGKNIIAEKGFKDDFIEHLDAFLDAWQEAFDYISEKIKEE